MSKERDKQQNILHDFFYPEQDLEQKVLSMTQMSILDALTIKSSRGDIKTQLENGELPSEYLYLAGADIYNKNCFSVNSPYHAVSLLEASGLLENASKLDQYLGSTIIDIGCGNGSKPASLLKYIKSIGQGIHIKKYFGLDGSVSMLRATEDNFHKAKIPDLEIELGKQRFQELNLNSIEGKRTFSFFGGSLGTFSTQEELEKFLEDLNNNMGKDDTFICTVFTLPEDEKKYQEISDEELKKLQERFLKAERERYDINHLREKEKQIDVDNLRKAGVQNINTIDIDIDFFFDEKEQLLIDRKTFNKDIQIYGETIFHKGEFIDTPGIKLDRSFFQPMIKKSVKDFSESIYNTNQSREFVLNFFDRYLHADMNKLAYKAQRNDETHTMEIYVECLGDVNLYPQNSIVSKKKGDKILIHRSHRFTYQEIENNFDKSGFEILDSLKIGGDLELNKQLVHDEIMKIYILKKK